MSNRPSSSHAIDPRGFELAAEIAAKLERLIDLAYHAPISEDPRSRVVGIWADKIADEMRQLHALSLEVIAMDGEIVVQASVGLPEKQA